MKRALSLALALLLCLSLFACDKAEETNTPKETTATQPTEHTEPPTQATELPTEAPATEPAHKEPYTVYLQEEPDYNNFDVVSELWNTHKDIALKEPSTETLYVSTPDGKRTTICCYLINGNIVISGSLSPAASYNWSYATDGTLQGKTVPVILSDNEWESFSYNYKTNNYSYTFFVDGKIKKEVKLTSGSLMINLYGQTPENITDEEQLKTLIEENCANLDFPLEDDYLYTVTIHPGAQAEKAYPYYSANNQVGNFSVEYLESEN